MAERPTDRTDETDRRDGAYLSEQVIFQALFSS
jgi:hypothetical protein